MPSRQGLNEVSSTKSNLALGKVNLFVDSGVCNEDRKMGMGDMASNLNGHVFFSSAFPSVGSFEPLVAKAKALLQGLSLCLQLGYTSITAFSDCQRAGMLGKSLASPLLTYKYAPRTVFSTTDVVTGTTTGNIALLNVNSHCQNGVKVSWTSCSSKKWVLKSTAQIENMIVTEEDKKQWEACREALCTYKFSNEEADKILGKAFGQIHSPYWGEERKKVVPKLELVNEILDYLRNLNLSEDDLAKVLKKFPEVLGCDLEDEVKVNVQVLEKEWEIKGKTLRNLLLRNPRLLGYNIDCKGDCAAQCTRCWARF
uniref:RNase H type-1 domain-containing protein n=2 Tax=Cannabis sativa TaxID=3483 RepID=A0A803NNH4_CANSA